ncbi:MAG TPA: hypothetical protein VGA98_05105 [Allosphingosinicella sp.]
MATARKIPLKGTRAAVARSVIVSPLLNLAPADGTGATIRHRRPVLELGDSRIGGTATLSLSPDRRTIDVFVALDRPRAATLHLRRLHVAYPWNAAEAEENLLVVEVVPCGRSNVEPGLARRFSLDHRHACASFEGSEALLKAGICLSELRAGSVAGIHVEPALARRRAGPGQAEYLSERMLIEIGAAECSATAVAASRHVELATLYARRLRDAASQVH